jgi:hypothetical protein
MRRAEARRRRDLRLYPLCEVARLLALDIGGDGDRGLPIALVEDSRLAARGHMAELRQRNGTIGRLDRQIGDPAKIRALGFIQAKNHVQRQVAIAEAGRTRPPIAVCNDCWTACRQAQCADLVLVQVDADGLQRFAPITVHVARMAVRPDQASSLSATE